MRILLISLTALFASGCATNSGVVPVGQNTYMVSRQAATGFSGSGKLKAEAFQEASEYCTKISKYLQVVSTEEAKPPFILGNFPKAEVQFRCLDKNDPELSRPTLKPVPNIVIENK